MTPEALASYVRTLVDNAPPLAPEQYDRLNGLLHPATTVPTRAPEVTRLHSP